MAGPHSTDELSELEAPTADDYHHSAFAPLIGRDLRDFSEDSVFPLVQRIRQEVCTVIDTALSYDQLKSPTINFSIVRPLTTRLSRGARPPSPVLYALLVNRVQFLAEADEDLAFNGVNVARADLCELLATKMLSAYGTAPASLELLHVLTAPFSPFKGLTPQMLSHSSSDEIDQLTEWGEKQSSSALELGVFSGAKRFIRSPLVQQVVSGIYNGTICFNSLGGAHALLSDDWKTRPRVQVYDWRSQPFLDHYRLRVPAIRNRLEFMTFIIILALFLLTQTTRSHGHLNTWEVLFILWSLGFALDELSAIQENGLSAYFEGVYNALDSVFCFIFFAYLIFRTNGLLTNNESRSLLAFDTLALAGCVIFPRLSISLIRGNIVLLSLGVLVKEFIVFMALACLTASGFLAALWVLGQGSWGVGRISWMMLKIWLGNSFVGFEAASGFHPVYGPFLIVAFAILSQTLLLTILISLLSNSFAMVQANAQTEILHQKALRTIERVKSDALTSYMPPLNLLAFSILFVVKPFLTPRYFHKLNVLLIKIFNLPVLLFIALATRYKYHSSNRSGSTLQLTTALAAIPTGINWEGTADGLSKVFELDLTEFAVRVDEMDNPSSEEEDDSPPTTPLASPMASPGLKLNPIHAGNYHTKMPGVKRSNSRIGSLVSPLARMFSVAPTEAAPPPRFATLATQGLSKSTSSKPEGGGTNEAIEARLDSIERSLSILLRELTNKEPATSSKIHLTSLQGVTEESLGNDSD